MAAAATPNVKAGFAHHGRRPCLLLTAALGGLLLAADGFSAGSVKADAPSQVISACSLTTVESKRFRMAPSPGDAGYKPSASAVGKEVLISLANGIGVYAGDGDAFILSNDFAPGHSVKLCLRSVPKTCPPGDQRGKTYSLTDRQTHRSVKGIDSWHLCGGA